MAQSNAQRTDEPEQESTGRRPVDTAKHGNVEIAIWRNAGSGGDFYSASTPTIRYKDGEEWKNGSSLRAKGCRDNRRPFFVMMTISPAP
jgi:hypothetical protein